MNPGPIYTVDEFERESRYLDSMVWDAMAIAPGMSVLFCGYGPDGEQVRRALAMGIDTTVIEHRDTVMNRFAGLGAKLIRGSTSVVPAKENAFDLAVAFHYLHEIDPFFHAQVLSELGRVGRRVALVEPSPPADALGKRISILYSQAKRELGQFEYYQPLEYWKKLLQSVKADITQHVFAFAKVPPREYLTDTIELLLRTIEVEQAPQEYVDELRQLARRSDQLLPPPRYVLVGAAAGELIVPRFHNREEVEAAARPTKSATMAAAATAIAAAAIAAPTPAAPPPAAPPVAPAPADATPVTPEEGYEFPPVEPPAPKPAGPQAAPVAAPKPIPGPPPTVPTPKPANTPFGVPFAAPAPDAFGAPPAGIPASTTWAWEPPEGGEDEDEPFKPM